MKNIIETKVSDEEIKKIKNNQKKEEEEIVFHNDENEGMDKAGIKNHEEATVTCALINKVLYVEKGIVHVDVAWFAAIDIEHASCSYSAGKSDYVVDTNKIDIELVDDENDAEYVTKFVEFAKTFVDTYTKEAMVIAEQEKHV